MDINASHAFYTANIVYSLGLTTAVYRKTDGVYSVNLAGKAVARCANKDTPLPATDFNISVVELGLTILLKSDKSGSWSYSTSKVSSWASGHENADHLTLNLCDTKKNVVATECVPLVTDGGKGEKGAAPRGPRAWSDMPIGYNFLQGAVGEDYKDIVVYNDKFYYCKKSHTKTASNYPGSTEDTSNGYWEAASNFEMVATKILFAAYALVKNLGVEAIEMKDKSGNVLFEAKDGNVTCMTGTFENITVNGTVKANLMYGKVVRCDFTKSGNGTYTIDPVKEPGTTFVPGKGTAVNSEILLPKASDYDGLELNVCMMGTWPLTRNGVGWGIYIGCSSSSDKIYVKNSIDFGQCTTINNKKVYLANMLEPYSAETKIGLLRNMFAKFISLEGVWWAIIGDFYKSK